MEKEKAEKERIEAEANLKNEKEEAITSKPESSDKKAKSDANPSGEPKSDDSNKLEANRVAYIDNYPEPKIQKSGHFCLSIKKLDHLDSL